MRTIVKYILIFGIIGVIIGAISPLISADLIIPGVKEIPIYNYIENIDDFPDYEFISGGDLGDMCQTYIVKEDGKVGGGYKFCSGFVYAFPKGTLKRFEREWAITKNNILIKLENMSYSEYFESIGGIKVLEGLMNNKAVPETSVQEEIVKYYEIDFETPKQNPSKVKYEINYGMLIVSILISLIALIIIIATLIRKKK